MSASYTCNLDDNSLGFIRKEHSQQDKRTSNSSTPGRKEKQARCSVVRKDPLVGIFIGLSAVSPDNALTMVIPAKLPDWSKLSRVRKTPGIETFV